MPDRLFTIDETRDAFTHASQWWTSLVGAVEPGQWDEPGLDAWTTKELVIHTDRAYRTLVEYLDSEVKDPTPLASAAAYFRVVLSEATPHVHIAARAQREALEVLDPLDHTDHWSERAATAVALCDGGEMVHTFVGEIRVDQYLATRVIELVVHGIDLAEVIRIPVSPPPGAARIALAVLTDLVQPDELSVLLRALTGRAQLLPGIHVLD